MAALGQHGFEQRHPVPDAAPAAQLRQLDELDRDDLLGDARDDRRRLRQADPTQRHGRVRVRIPVPLGRRGADVQPEPADHPGLPASGRGELDPGLLAKFPVEGGDQSLPRLEAPTGQVPPAARDVNEQHPAVRVAHARNTLAGGAGLPGRRSR